MKKVVLLITCALFLGNFIGTANQNKDPVIEKVTFTDVLEQNNQYFAIGWNAMDLVSVQSNYESHFVIIHYERYGEEFAYASPIIQGFNLRDCQDLKYTILSQNRKPRGSKIKQLPGNYQTHFVSAGAMPGTCYMGGNNA